VDGWRGWVSGGWLSYGADWIWDQNPTPFDLAKGRLCPHKTERKAWGTHAQLLES